jgi:hypothetical protein
MCVTSAQGLLKEQAGQIEILKATVELQRMAHQREVNELLCTHKVQVDRLLDILR